MKQHWEKNGRVWVDQECINACWNKIFIYIRIGSLNHHLITYGLASATDDLLGNDQAKAKSNLLQLVASSGPCGPYLFYMCLLDSYDEAKGHAEAALLLMSTGANNSSFHSLHILMLCLHGQCCGMQGTRC